MGRQKSASSSASCKLSFTLDMSATSIMAVRLKFAGRSKSAWINPARSSSIVYLVVGTNRFRKSSRAAWTLQANTHDASDNLENTLGSGATVDTVTLDALNWNDSRLVKILHAWITFSALSAGSPIPMNTMFVISGKFSRRQILRAKNICDKISSLDKDRSRPIRPVAQNVHPCRHPTCEEIQRVLRTPFQGIITVSTSSPSWSFSKSFVVSSLALLM
mmetsp:Transcript_3876/g.5601  ORF Transcript_3876/g.5601 Transcript_3876/m.5601 type:complete len:218 (+) Transcript_3876:292-945(+)